MTTNSDKNENEAEIENVIIGVDRVPPPRRPSPCSECGENPASIMAGDGHYCYQCWGGAARRKRRERFRDALADWD